MTFADDLLERLQLAAWFIVLFTVITFIFGAIGIFAPLFTLWDTLFLVFGLQMGLGIIISGILQLIQIYAWIVAWRDLKGALARRG
jgi:hypothetical protein